MQRRQFVNALATGAIASTLPNAHAEGATFKWRLVLDVPKTMPVWGPAIVRLADNLEKLSAGRMKIKVYGAGELLPAFGSFDAVKNGEIEMAQSVTYYHQGKVPESVFFCGVPFGMTFEGMTAWFTAGDAQALWDELMVPHNMVCLPCGGTHYQTAGWFNREIKSVEDLKGLKVRMPGLAGKVLAKLGANPVLLPAGEIFTSLATGVLDAVEWTGPYQDYVMGFHKIAKYYYVGAWHEVGPAMELMINRTAWDSLPEDLKLLVRICSAETHQWMNHTWSTKDAEYLEKIRTETKVEIRELPVDVLQALKKQTDVVLNEMVANSAIGKRIYDSYSAFQKRFEAYNDLSQRPLIRAFQKAEVCGA